MSDGPGVGSLAKGKGSDPYATFAEPQKTHGVDVASCTVQPMHHRPAPARHDAVALQAGMLGSVLGVGLFKALALSGVVSGSLMGMGLWLLACVLLGAWALAAGLACLALSRRVFVLMLALSAVFVLCIA